MVEKCRDGTLDLMEAEMGTGIRSVIKDVFM